VEQIDVADEIFIVNRANWIVGKAVERLEMELLGIHKRQESKDLSLVQLTVPRWEWMANFSLVSIAGQSFQRFRVLPR
jgi:isocitrate dehydrogenase kinase/phosphatase